MPGAGAVANGAELVAGEPVGPGPAGREIAADAVIDAHVGDSAVGVVIVDTPTVADRVLDEIRGVKGVREVRLVRV